MFPSKRVGKRVVRWGLRHGSTGMTKEIHNNDPWVGPIEPGINCYGETRDGKALILGMYTCDSEPESKHIALTRTSMRYNQYTCNKLVDQLRVSGIPKLGECAVLYNVEPTIPVVVVVGLGSECYGYNKVEQRDEGKEAVRIGAGAGIRALERLKISKLYIESLGNTEAAAEGAGLGLWKYQDLKQRSKRWRVPYLGLYDDCDFTAWEIGLEKASAQNLARQLMETPSNLMTPTSFALSAVEALARSSVSIDIKVAEWMGEHKMNAFLAVSKGSIEAPLFLEITYNGCDPCDAPVVLIGKGVTFDAGGLCLKPLEDSQNMRGDMAGAACVLATVRAVSSLKLPVNLRGLIPLCENVPGASSIRPGDIVKAMNGKSILIENTDFEGALLLADALVYAQKYKPKFIVDVATMNPTVKMMVSDVASAIFTNSDDLWASIKAASIHTGDRVWRFPLWALYEDQIKPSHVTYDLTNFPVGNCGHATTSAAFLHQFVCNTKWMHCDTINVMWEDGQTPYLTKGMSGRPTRTLIEFIAQLACQEKT